MCTLTLALIAHSTSTFGGRYCTKHSDVLQRAKTDLHLSAVVEDLEFFNVCITLLENVNFRPYDQRSVSTFDRDRHCQNYSVDVDAMDAIEPWCLY
jgi:hypothetical protein